ncbi:surface polysaccharide O-acyltransferase-like enzyme [Chryseobacterium ginsenosidimutans]|uniref:acyltransferase family protein n=1 Tax=Chryseobacterium ginsenosidimutans TaxID=687846 RepID=UPI0027806D5B|nr:acyltransferase family protein [Chryseobacterium ginsenosidimutans]MDQ0593760.1 surface polysaccharide O-acyltransferase-like enzyme [Chryseobacterium ginsenosidimutans]
MRSLSIDLLKIVLAFFVVCLHMHVLRDSNPSLSYVLVNGLFRIGVPVFLIISGYFFYFVDNIQRLKKWSFRILLLYIIWSLVYFPLWKEDDSYFLNILFGYHHLWYLIGTFFSGLLLFSLRNISPKILISIILFFFCCGYTIQFLGNSHYFNGEIDATLNLFPTYRNFLFVCFPFLGIGFLIKKLEIDVKRKPSLLLVLTSVFLVIFEAFLNYKILKLSQKESIDLLFSLLIACPLLFLYCKNISIKTDSKILASFSTAIYLIHPLVMEFVYKSTYITSFQDVIFTLILLIISLILVLLNRKVKYLL